MKCNNCGKEIKEKSLFCPNCGTIVGSNVKTKTVEKQKNNYILIILALLLLFFAIACFIIFKNSGQLVNMNGVKVYVPNDYEEKIKQNYDEAYISPKEDVMIGVITQESNDIKLDEYIEILKSSLKSANLKCEQEFTKNIKKVKWTKFNCKSEDEKANMYITVKNKKVYIVSLEAIKEKDISNLENKIESNLELIR